MTVFLLKDDSNMILVILYFIFSAWSCLLCFASRQRQHPKGEVLTFALVYSTANVWSLIRCLASRWRPHPRGDVPPRLPLEPLRRPLSENMNNHFEFTVNTCALYATKVVHEKRQSSPSGQYAPALSNKLHPCNVMAQLE